MLRTRNTCAIFARSKIGLLRTLRHYCSSPFDTSIAKSNFKICSQLFLLHFIKSNSAIMQLNDESSSSSSQTSALLFDTIAVMRSQEDNRFYQTHDFLSSCNDMVSYIDIDMECRSKMCAWCYQVADYCKFSRESVEVALSYLDRFMASTHGTEALQNRSTYQLASMTCMYMAIKIHERQAMSPDVVSQLSQGVYSPLQIEQMETKILTALDWRMNPPTVTSFSRALLLLAGISSREYEVAMELARLQSEVATSAYHLMATPPSIVALAISCNALESLGSIKRSNLRRIKCSMETSLGRPDCNVDVIRSFLYESLTSSPLPTSKKPMVIRGSKTEVPDRRASWQESPRSVSDRNLKVYDR